MIWTGSSINTNGGIGSSCIPVEVLPGTAAHVASLSFELCQWLQAKLDVEMYIQITDDEKLWARSGLSSADTRRWGYENLLDILAVGFDRRWTHVFFDTQSIQAMYPLAVEVAKKIRPTVKAVFGFAPSANIGLVFYTALQTVPCFYPSQRAGRIDPLPHSLRNRSRPALSRDPRRRRVAWISQTRPDPQPNASRICRAKGRCRRRGPRRERALPERCASATVEKKIRKAFTGGRATVEEQRRLGAVPEICSIWALWRSSLPGGD